MAIGTNNNARSDAGATKVIVVRDRCIRCKAPISMPADAVPMVTVFAEGREYQGFRCRLCDEHKQHMQSCTKPMHVERW